MGGEVGADHGRSGKRDWIGEEEVTDTELEQDAGLEGAPDDTPEADEPEITEEDALEQEEDDAQPAEPDPDSEQEPEARGLSEAEIEKQYKQLESEQKRHTNAVSKIMGDAAIDLIVCPLCEPELQGFLRMESLDHPRDEIHEAMIGVLKKPQQVEYQLAPHAVTCVSCDGLGQVLSGSRVPGKERIVCPTCSGNGYNQSGASTSNGHTINPTSEYVPSGLPFEPLEDERDEFGSPRYLDDGRENPNYGKTMRYKDSSIENEYLLRLSGQL